MKELRDLTMQVCKVARQAGGYIRGERARFCVDKVERKHAHDYVSYVDKGSEQMIVEKLRELLPEAGFITEEGLATHSTNFIHGFAPYAVSIALIRGHRILIGVVYEICAQECYYAWQDGGAFVESGDECESLHVGKSEIGDALLCMQLPYNSDAYKPVIKKLIDRFYGNVGSIRMIGSAAMALCYVAAGRLDAYAERYIGQWDYMAGALIVMEAGGRVTDYGGSVDFTQGDSVVATNGKVHDALLEAVRNT